MATRFAFSTLQSIISSLVVMLVIDLTEQMIIFDAPLESWVDKSIKIYCDQLKKNNMNYSVYFLIGSFCSDGDIYIAHVAKCPLPITAEDSEGDQLSKNFDDEWIADNAEKITRILPGGVHVVGLAWFSDRKIPMDQKNMLSRALARIQRTTNSLTTLNLGTISDSMALVIVEVPNGRPQGLIIDVVRRSPDSPTKVSFSVLEWVSIVSNASTKVCLNLPCSDKHMDFYNEFVAAIKPFAENLMNCGLVLIDGIFRNYSDPLFKDIKKRKKNAIEAQLFLDSCFSKENTCHQEIATNLYEISFDIEIRAAVPVKSKIETATLALKHHLLRSLTARAELQYESMDVVEDSSPTMCSVHQMPRPATTILPNQSAILLSDYLFEADTIEDAQKNFEELLELKTNIEHVDEGWERSLEIEEMEAVRAPLKDSSVVSFRSRNDEGGSALMIFIALSIIVVIVAVIVYLVIGN